MPSILQKCQTLLNADMVGMIDRAFEIQSTGIINEYLKQLEINLEALEESTETVAGAIKTLKRKYEEFQEHADTLDRDIDALILRGKDDLAMAGPGYLNTKAELAQEYYEQWQGQKEKHQRMQATAPYLEQRTAYIRQLSEHMARAFANGEQPDVAELHRQAEIERAKYNTYLDEQNKVPDSSIGIGQVELDLAERKRRLMGNND